MKKATKLKAFMLSLIMTALLLPMTSFAQSSDDFFCVDDAFNGNRDVVAWNITNNGIGQSEAPVGSGLLVLGAIGAGYAIAKRKRNKKGAALLLALALTLGFTQCKKKVVEPIANNGNTVHITLTMAGGDSRVIVDPTNGGANNYASVSFESGDKIYVGNGGKYVGYVTYNGTDTWEGDLTSPTTDDYLHLYFLGNKAPLSDVTPGTTTEFSVSIADQASKYPVISYNHTLEKYNGAGSYTATTLYNKCSIMKFNVATGTNYANDPIRMTGMHNKVTVNFATPNASENGFSYSVNTTDGGLIKMPTVVANVTWAIVLPQDALAEGTEGSTYTNGYKGKRPEIAEIVRNTYYNSGVSLDITTADDSKIKDLSTLTANWEAEDGWTLTGTLNGNYKITIAPGATVTLNNVTINGTNDSDYKWAGITCLGNATIILSGTNNVKGFYENYPGIYVPENKTVTIQGSGSLTASSNGWGAGIGGGREISCGAITISGGTITATGKSGAGIGGGYHGTCGNISITGGTVTATGGDSAAGIGSGSGGTCGDITISGGTVEATGGDHGAGIGTGYYASCGNITITSGVTCVTATKGATATNSIGAGYYSTCGTVTIGGVETGPISDSPYIYPVPITYPIALGDATSDYVGSVVTTDGYVYATVAAASAASKTAVAVIAYVGTAGSVDASSATYKGLAVALSDANSGSKCKWADGLANCLSSSQTDAIATALGFKNGITCTSTLTAAGHSSHGHAAATAAASNNSTDAPTGTSGWFMPSMGQWNLIVQGLATKKAGSAVTTDLEKNTKNDTYKADNLNSVITDAGGTGFQEDYSYWASTEETTSRAWAIDFWGGYAIGYSKNNTNHYVRSIIAF